MIQGTSKNVDSFITDYIEQLIPGQRNFNIEQLSKEELIIKTPNDTKAWFPFAANSTTTTQKKNKAIMWLTNHPSH